MSDVNPYASPESELYRGTAGQTGQLQQPVVLAKDGRIGRLRYIAYGMGVSLAFYVVLGIAGSVFAALLGNAAASAYQFFAPIITLLMFVFGVVVTVVYARRRLHDLDKNGWLSVLTFVPMVNVIFWFYLVLAPGTAGANSYGLPPTENPLGVKILALIVPLIFILGMLFAISVPAYMDYVDTATRL